MIPGMGFSFLTRATVKKGVHHFSSEAPNHLRSSVLSPKMDLFSKMKVQSDEQTRDPGILALKSSSGKQNNDFLTILG